MLMALMVLAAWAGQLPLFLVAFGSVLYHELCHVLAAVLCGYSVTRIEVLPFGSVAQIQGLFEERPQSEMLIALAGPAANGLYVYRRQAHSAISYAGWKKMGGRLREYATGHPEYFKQYIREDLHMTDAEYAQYFGE